MAQWLLSIIVFSAETTGSWVRKSALGISSEEQSDGNIGLLLPSQTLYIDTLENFL